MNMLGQLGPVDLGAIGGIVAGLLIVLKIFDRRSQTNGTQQLLATLVAKMENVHDRLNDLQAQITTLVVKYDLQSAAWNTRLTTLENEVKHLEKERDQ